jgi:GR25 family glycosyltransferase involved in LPS biosynthesis
MLAPIVLFAYNRPIHTQKTLEALAKNDLANQSILYVFIDKIEDKNQNYKTRLIIDYVNQYQNFFQKVYIIEREKHYGLADNIVSGVTQTVTEYGKVIVLEDDIVTSEGFLTYMNEALTLYENEEKVMHISGYILPLSFSHQELKKIPSTFFHNQTSCWGWATWKRSWQFFSIDAQKLLTDIQRAKREREFDLDNSYPSTQQLYANAKGILRTWAVKWQASVFLKNGYCLYPKMSLLQNIGFDGTGENCHISSVYKHKKIAKYVKVEKNDLEENLLIRKKIIKFNLLLQKTSLSNKIRNFLYKIFPNKYLKKYRQLKKMIFVDRHI